MTDRRGAYLDGSLQRRREDVAWAAGFFDGEGMVRLNTCHSSLFLYVSNTHRSSLVRLQLMFGGHIGKKKRYTRRHRPTFCWTVTGVKARTAASRLLPFLHEKAEQVRLALTVKTGARGTIVAEDERVHRVWVARELSRLKRVISQDPQASARTAAALP